MIVWWGTPVECVCAVARREREALLSLEDATAALAMLRGLASGWQEVLATDAVRNTAQRLLRTHPLRSADSLQLAAAIVAAELEPASLEFVSLDQHLNEAAMREGFPVVKGSVSSRLIGTHDVRLCDRRRRFMRSGFRAARGLPSSHQDLSPRVALSRTPRPS